jgi:glycosyltransferase involved in cell wall biosynthesis
MRKILFILKKRPKGPYGSWNYSIGEELDSGLLISAREVVEMLDSSGLEVKLVQVVDNNGIDAEVFKYKPDCVIIEAFWVIPSKFEVLKKLHPNVKWVIRCHSKVDFLSHEGAVFGWVLEYVKQGIYVGCNSIDTTENFQELCRILDLDRDKIIYLPNYYSAEYNCNNLLNGIISSWKIDRGPTKTKVPGEISIGCFGAIRTLKNHMVQALAAINVADYLGLSLRFHISSNREEGERNGTLKALKALFNQTGVHKLIELPWSAHEEFLDHIERMDLCFQVSISETFNIVCADAVSRGVPVVASDQLPWLTDNYTVSKHNDVQEVSSKAIEVWNSSYNKILIADQVLQLLSYTSRAKTVWLNTLDKRLTI